MGAIGAGIPPGSSGSSPQPEQYAPDWKEIHRQDIIMRNFDLFVEYHRQKPSPRNYTGIKTTSARDTSLDAYKLVGTKNYESYLKMDSHVFSSLVPMVNIYKVGKSGNPVLIEMSSDIGSDAKAINGSGADKLEVVLKDRLSRGVGGGIRSVSIDLKGSNMASAKSMYEVEIQYFFSSMKDMFANRNGYRYIDLFSKSAEPNPDPCSYLKKGKSEPDPHGTRIMLEFGYKEPPSGAVKLSQKQRDLLKENIKVIFLNIYKHKVDFKENGSVIVTANYMGYVERSMSKIDVFSLLAASNPTTGMKFSEIRQLEYGKCVAQAKGKKGKKATSTKARQHKEKKEREKNEKRLKSLRKICYSEIFTKLARDGQIYAMTIKPSEDMDKFYRFKGALANVGGVSSSISNLTKRRERAEKQRSEGGGTAALHWWHRTTDFEWVYLGDVIDQIMSLTKKVDKDINVVLGNINVKYLEAGKKNKTKSNSICLAHFPISAQAWEEWWMHHALQMGERTRYYLSDFLKDILEGLVAGCFDVVTAGKSDQQNSPTLGAVTFSAMPFQTPEELPKGIQSISTLVSKSTQSSRGPSRRKLGKNANLLVYANHPRFTADKTVGKTTDQKKNNKNGIYHLIASDQSGVVKRIKFKHSDAKFGAETRMINQGMNSAEASLWGFYNADVELVGSSAFYPGALVRISSREFTSTQGDKFGLGGYYRVIEVNHKIQDSVFTTELKCQWERVTNIPPPKPKGGNSP